MPESWRDLPLGTFNADGLVPNLNDIRINWHVGNLEETIGNLKFVKKREHQALIFFDLDIFAPSLIAWNGISKNLRVGDVLYFDEAFDKDERMLLNNYILTFGKFELIAASWMSLAIKLIEIY